MKNFIWDFDGTIYDSYPHLAKAFTMMCDNRGREYSYDEVINALQVSFDYAFEKFSLNESEINEFRSYSRDSSIKPEIKPYADTEEVLKHIVAQGGVNYIYTHRDKASLTFYLQKYNLISLFCGFVTSDDGFEKKPSPQAVNYIIQNYNLDKKETIMIGDREIDVLSGINAGINGGLFIKDKNISDTKANFIFKNLSSIKPLI